MIGVAVAHVERGGARRVHRDLLARGTLARGGRGRLGLETDGRHADGPTDMAAFEKVIRINLLGSLRCLSLSAAGMMAVEPLEDGERGLVLSTASVAAQDGQIGQAAYAASKGGVYAMTLPAARDLMNEGIRVNTILPGIMLTPMMAAMPQNVQDALAASIPFPKRLGRPEEYASLVLEMCRNASLQGECVRLYFAIRMPPR